MEIAVFLSGQETGGKLIPLGSSFEDFLSAIKKAHNLPSEAIQLKDASGNELKTLDQVKAARFAYALSCPVAHEKSTEAKTAQSGPAKVIPGPTPRWIVGNIDLLRENQIQNIQKCFDQYGPVFALYLYNERNVYVGDADVAEEVLRESDTFSKIVKDNFLSELKNFTGDGVFTTSTHEHNWELGHKLLTPGFSLAQMKNYIPDIVDVTQRLLSTFDEFHKRGQRVDVKNWMTRYTLSALGQCAFGYDFHMLDSPDAPEHDFIKALYTCLKIAIRRQFSFRVTTALSIRQNMEYREAIKLMRTIVKEVLDERRKNPSTEKVDMLTFMINSKDPKTGEQLSDDLILDNIITFMIAGHETTSTLLSWTFYVFNKYPDVEARIRQEAISILGNDLSKTPTAQDLGKMEYTGRAIKECLRLFSPITQVGKKCLKKVELGGFQFEEGDTVKVYIYDLHRQKKHWGQIAEAFDPDNFLPERVKARHPSAFVPFSTGQRACIGMQFALYEAKIALAYITRKYFLSLPMGVSVTHNPFAPTLVPVGLIVELVPRDAIPERKSTSTLPLVPPPSSLEKKEDKSGEGPASLISAHDESLEEGRRISRLPPPKFTILFGSNGGCSSAFASRIYEAATRAKVEAVLHPLDEWPLLDKLEKGEAPSSDGSEFLLIVTSTYQGLPPDNAVRFNQFLDKAQTDPKKSELLKGWQYAVFGCGNSNWRTYQQYPTKISSALPSLGATEFVSRGEGDADQDIETDWVDWGRGLHGELLLRYNLLQPEVDSSSGSKPDAVSVDLIRVKIEASTLKALSESEAREASAKSFLPALKLVELEVNEARQVAGPPLDQTPREPRRVVHLEFSIPSPLKYVAGDHVEVLPSNQPDLVKSFAERVGYNLDQVVAVEVAKEGLENKKSAAGAIPAGVGLTVKSILTFFVDLQTPPSRKAVLALSLLTECPPEKARLQAISESSEEYSSYILKGRRTLLELLNDFKSVETISLAWLVSIQNRLSTRRYSISSAPDVHPNAVHATVGVLHGISPTGRLHLGVCSNFLASNKKGDKVWGTVRPCQDAFHPPDDATVPIIMIGPGTGVAPFRGFIQHRQAQLKSGAKLGETILYFGCRSHEDFLYKDELENYVKEGVLTKLFTAFSRVEGMEKTYVQHQILQNGDEIWRLLSEQNARVYVCGDARGMARDVGTTFEKIVQLYGKRNEQLALQYLSAMRENGRYVEDVWG